MRKERLEIMRKRLIELREDLLTEIKVKNAEAATLTDEGVPDLADLGLTDNLKEFLHLLSDSKRTELIRIDEALERLDDESYGFCQNCGTPIDIERLDLRPYTRFCVTCKDKQEKEDILKRGPGHGLM